MIREFLILLTPEDVGFSVSVPSLPGCDSQGDTLAEAKANIQEAILLHLRSFGSEVDDREALIGHVDVLVAGVGRRALPDQLDV